MHKFSGPGSLFDRLKTLGPPAVTEVVFVGYDGLVLVPVQDLVAVDQHDDAADQRHEVHQADHDLVAVTNVFNAAKVFAFLALHR